MVIEWSTLSISLARRTDMDVSSSLRPHRSSCHRDLPHRPRPCVVLMCVSCVSDDSTLRESSAPAYQQARDHIVVEAPHHAAPPKLAGQRRTHLYVRQSLAHTRPHRYWRTGRSCRDAVRERAVDTADVSRPCWPCATPATRRNDRLLLLFQCHEHESSSNDQRVELQDAERASERSSTQQQASNQQRTATPLPMLINHSRNATTLS